MAENYALFVGINYIGTENQLDGCIDDIEAMRKEFIKVGFPATNIQMLSDGYEGAQYAPTKDNIMTQLKALVAKAKPGDTIYFHYSGHGTNSLRVENDYEALCPIKDGEIELLADYEIYEVLKQLPVGAKLVSAIDACHSGDMFNLEYNLAGDKPGHEGTDSHGYIVMMSGCQVEQTSADAVLEEDGKPTPQGAFTGCMLAMIEQLGVNSILDTLLSASKNKMRQLDSQMISWLRGKNFSQRPDFSFEGQLIPTLASGQVLHVAPQQAAPSAPAISTAHHTAPQHTTLLNIWGGYFAGLYNQYSSRQASPNVIDLPKRKAFLPSKPLEAKKSPAKSNQEKRVSAKNDETLVTPKRKSARTGKR
ncbi:MAG: caspase family protein [Proteobacteria bacterium]|nr:caspase family protein [Pseudomonadota bacterium]